MNKTAVFVAAFAVSTARATQTAEAIPGGAPIQKSFGIWWIVFGVPFAAAVAACVGLASCWRSEQHRFVKALAVLLPTLAALWACGALAYVQFVRSLPAFDLAVESWGLLLSLSGCHLRFCRASVSTPQVLSGSFSRVTVDVCAIFSGSFNILSSLH